MAPAHAQHARRCVRLPTHGCATGTRAGCCWGARPECWSGLPVASGGTAGTACRCRRGRRGGSPCSTEQRSAARGEKASALPPTWAGAWRAARLRGRLGGGATHRCRKTTSPSATKEDPDTPLVWDATRTPSICMRVTVVSFASTNARTVTLVGYSMVDSGTVMARCSSSGRPSRLKSEVDDCARTSGGRHGMARRHKQRHGRGAAATGQACTRSCATASPSRPASRPPHCR